MLPFEPAFLEKFHTFDAVTGDFTRLRETTISPPQKKPIRLPISIDFTPARATPRYCPDGIQGKVCITLMKKETADLSTPLW